MLDIERLEVLDRETVVLASRLDHEPFTPELADQAARVIHEHDEVLVHFMAHGDDLTRVIH